MLNENIKALRKAKGLSQEELAIKLVAWDVSACPLYLHQPLKEGAGNTGYTFLPALLFDLENNPEYLFLRSCQGFIELIAEYKDKVSLK